MIKIMSTRQSCLHFLTGSQPCLISRTFLSCFYSMATLNFVAVCLLPLVIPILFISEKTALLLTHHLTHICTLPDTSVRTSLYHRELLKQAIAAAAYSFLETTEHGFNDALSWEIVWNKWELEWISDSKRDAIMIYIQVVKLMRNSSFF